MATGPHSSDTVQRYLRRLEEFMDPSDLPEARNRQLFDGKLRWDMDASITEMIENLGEAGEAGDDVAFLMPETGLTALDDVYDAVKTTQNGNNKLAGLRAYRIPWDTPIDTESRSWDHWVDGYFSAGLIQDRADPEETDPTREGEIFLDIDPGEYDTDRAGFDELGDFYRTLSSQNGGEPDGTGIETFLLYGSGFGHTDIERIAGIPESTARSTGNSLRDMGLLDEDYEFTDDGEAFGRMVLDQVEALEEATEERVMEEYGGWESLDPQDYSGNSYMAESLRKRRL